MDEKTLLRLVKTHGTPLVVVDHDVLRENYGQFRSYLPRVQVYFAVKANSAPAIVRTFYEAGSSFDVASVAEFLTVHENVKDLSEAERQALYLGSHHLRQSDQGDRNARAAGPVQTARHLRQLRGSDQDCPARAACGSRAAVTGPEHRLNVELSSKFGALPGEAVDLISFAHNNKLEVEGLSFHVGSQCTNIQNYIQARTHGRRVLEARSRGFELKLLDIGGGFPAHYDDTVPKFKSLAQAINPELDRLFPPPIEILAEPGRFLVASAATAIAQIIGKVVRDGKLCYYVNDGVYQTYSGIIFDHCHTLKSFKKGPTQLCSVFGPTCDALDTISLAEQLRTWTSESSSTHRTSGPTQLPAARTSMVSRQHASCM